jgi:hypothetical protein
LVYKISGFQMQEIAVVAWPNIAAIAALPLEMPAQVQVHETFLFSTISWQYAWPTIWIVSKIVGLDIRSILIIGYKP